MCVPRDPCHCECTHQCDRYLIYVRSRCELTTPLSFRTGIQDTDANFVSARWIDFDIFDFERFTGTPADSRLASDHLSSGIGHIENCGSRRIRRVSGGLWNTQERGLYLTLRKADPKFYELRHPSDNHRLISCPSYGSPFTRDTTRRGLSFCSHPV